MESVAYVQSVKDSNLCIMTANFDWALLDACRHLGPFWMHPDIWGKYRIEFQKRFASRGFRFNPLTMQDDRVGVFVEPLGSYFIVFQIESSDDMLSRTALEDLWANCGRCLGALGQGALDSDRSIGVLVVPEASEGGALVAVSAANLSNNYMFYYNKAYAIVTGDIRCLA